MWFFVICALAGLPSLCCWPGCSARDISKRWSQKKLTFRRLGKMPFEHDCIADMPSISEQKKLSPTTRPLCRAAYRARLLGSVVHDDE